MPYPSNRSAIDLFVRRLSAHSTLSSQEAAEICALPATPVTIAAHHDLVRLGQTVNHACLVSEGLIGRFGQTEDGARQFVSLHIPGEMVDLPSVMMPQSMTALNAVAASTVFKIPHENLRDLGFRFPAIAAAFWRDCVLDARIVSQWLINVGRRDARSRMAHLFNEMAVRYHMLDQSDGQTFRLPMSQEQLGDALGLTPVHVNRTLMALRSDGLVEFDRGKVRIADRQRLARVGEFDPAYLDLAVNARGSVHESA